MSIYILPIFLLICSVINAGEIVDLTILGGEQLQDTGSMRYSSSISLMIGRSKPLMLYTSIENDELAPITANSLKIDDNSFVFLGWSSLGGGTETMRAMQLGMGKDQTIVLNEISIEARKGSIDTKLTRSNNSVYLMIYVAANATNDLKLKLNGSEMAIKDLKFLSNDPDERRGSKNNWKVLSIHIVDKEFKMESR